MNVRLPEKAEGFLGKYYLEKNGYSARRQTVTVMDQLFVPSGASKAPPAEVPFKETQNHTNPEGSSSTETLSPEETNPEYAYAAQMKLVAMLSAGELDVLLMDEDALAYFEQNKALLPHPSSCTYRSLEGTAFYQKAGFTGKVYVGIAANTKHRREAVNYLKYLSGDFR